MHSNIPSSSITMPISLLPQFFFFFILSIICIADLTHAYRHSQCLEDQRTLLLEFRNELSLDFSSSRKLMHWNQTEDCCSWGGVECDGAGHVIGLQLDDEGIWGGLENSSSLFSLRYLEELNLAGNFFYIPIPRGIGNLTYLRHLNLSDAGFSGQVPIELSLLRRLVSLDISWNGASTLRPEIPNLKMLIQNLTGLRELIVDGVDISATVPNFLANFSSLNTLSLKDCSLRGSLSEMIFQIPTLQELDLSENELLNGTLPQFPPNLRSIRLSVCNFNGPIPPTLANSTKLVYVDLSKNSFTGLIPPVYMSKKLTHIDVSFNILSGSFSSRHFEGLSNLVYIDLGYNSLTGSIPRSLLGLSSLETLGLSTNRFNGTLQLKMIRNLRNLTSLDLSHNNLSVDVSGTSSSLSTFRQLSHLGLASCNLHSFPDLRNQSNLLFLDLSNNNITGEIPTWIWDGRIWNGRIWDGPPSYLNLSCNKLVGLQKPYHIPTSLCVLDLHSNLLQGELLLPLRPNTRSITPSLYFFSIANNSLSGAIPNSLCNFTNLRLLDLSFNDLSGNIPPCLLENIEYLQVLNLGRNNISGDIPDKFSINCGLETLDLCKNNLGGKIPKSLANCKSLEVMKVGNNNIHDSFPCMLPSSLRLLVLRSNRFHGEVRCHSRWPNLQIIDVASNNFSGYLYSMNFSSWRGMMLGSHAELMRNELNFTSDGKGLDVTSDGKGLDYFQIDVTLIVKGYELKLVKIWGDFVSIDFSCNNFRGTIPAAIGDLRSLYLLNLSHNDLTGPIPKSFSKLKQLGSLDLSVNQLTGAIPEELAGLTFLSVLNLSHNKLVGMIPKGSQFQTFSAGSFEGNSGLCGLPLNISCNNTDDNDLSPPKQENQKGEIEWDYVCAALGYVVGLGSFLLILLSCQSLRIRYFEKVDEVLEKIFDCHGRKRRHGRRVLRNQVRRQ